MTTSIKSDILFLLSLIAAIWFLLTSWIPIYNIGLSLPAGIISYVLYKIAYKISTKEEHSSFTYIYKMLRLGGFIFLGTLILILIVILANMVVS